MALLGEETTVSRLTTSAMKSSHEFSDDSENENVSTPRVEARRKRERSSFVDSIFCNGAHSEAESVFLNNMTSKGVLQLAKNNDKKSRFGRAPFISMDVRNKHVGLSTMSTAPSDSSNACGFPPKISTLIPSSKPFGWMTRSQICGCDCACITCWDTHSNKQLIFAPSTNSASIPVIEELGVTPKSTARYNKYSTTQQMNSPGVFIPTPAMVRRKHTPIFDNIPEAIQATKYLEMEEADSVDDTAQSVVEITLSVAEEAFLPEDLTGTKENELLYTETDLRVAIADALANKDAGLEIKYASASQRKSNDSKQIQLQQHLVANQIHDRNKKSVLKAHIAMLEEQCKSLESSQNRDRREYQQQTEQLKLEANKIQDLSDAERTKTNVVVTLKQDVLDLAKRPSTYEEIPFIRDLEQKVRSLQDLEQKVKSLQAEKDLFDSREAELQEQINGLQGDVLKLAKALAKTRDRHSLDKKNLANLESQVEDLATEGSTLRNDLVILRKKLSSRDSDVTTMEVKFLQALAQGKEFNQKLEDYTQREKKLKAGLQRCIHLLSFRPNMHSESSSAYDEADWVDSSLETLEHLVSKLSDQLEESEQRARQAEENARKEIDSRVAAELEVATLLTFLESRNHDQGVSLSDDDSGSDSFANELDSAELEGSIKVESDDAPTKKRPTEKHREETPRQQGVMVINSYINISTSEVLTQLKNDIEGLKRSMPGRYFKPEVGGAGDKTKLLRLPEDYGWVLPQDEVNVLDKLVDDIYVQLKHVQEQYGRQYAHSTTPQPHSAGCNSLLEQLESQKLTLANKDKQHSDELHQLTEELELLRRTYESATTDGDPQAKRADSSLSLELEKVREKMKDAEASISNMREDIATKVEERNEILQALGLSQDQAKMFEKGLSRLLDNKANNKTEEMLRLRKEIKAELEFHFAERLNGDERQVQELLVMLELKQENENLTNKIKEQKERADAILDNKENLEQQVSDLTSKCQILKDDIEQKENMLASLTEDGAKRKVLQATVEQRIESILTQIEILEFEQEISVDNTKHAATDNTNHAATDESPVALQKLKRIERHLFCAWDDFARRKVTELTHQRRLLAGMKETITKHQRERKTTIQDLQVKLDESESNLEEARQSSQKARQSLESRLFEMEADFESKQHDTDQAMQQCRAKICDLEKDLEERRCELTVASLVIASLNGELSAALDDVTKANEQARHGLLSISSTTEKIAALAGENEELRHQISSLEIQMENLTKETEFVEAREKNQSRLELEKLLSECTRLEERLAMSKRESTSQDKTIKDLQAQIQTSRAECERLENLRAGTKEEEHLKRTAELEVKAQATIRNCEERVRKIREEHANEVEELLNQLDLVEAEHAETCNDKAKAVKEKDTIIAALGAQLAELQRRMGALDETSKDNLRIAEEAREDFRLAKKEADSWKADLEKLQAVHAKVFDSERIKRENAVKDAREETIQEATCQFEHFNLLYRTMTQNYKTATTRVRELETELLASQKALEELSKDHFYKLASLNSELVEIKAGMSLSSYARKLLKHLVELGT